MYKILPIYNGNEIINYCVGKGDRDYVLETLAFTDNLASLRRLDLKTLYNKTTALMYWYEYTYKVGKSYNAFFTLQEQMGFIRFLEKKEVENRKRSIYLTGKNNKQIGLAYGTVSRYIGYINEYYVFLYNFHYINLSIDMLPFRKSLNIRPAKLNRIRLPEILTVDEVNTLLNACDTYRDKALIALMVSTGLRLGEVCALKMEALDFKNQSVCCGKLKL